MLSNQKNSGIVTIIGEVNVGKSSLLNILVKKDVSIINKQYLKNMTFHYVENMHEVIDIALEKK